MIDVHCHLEQPDYEKDREKVIEECKKEMTAIITCCAHPKDFNLTMKLVEKHKNFVYASVGLHPIYVKEIKQPELEKYLQTIADNKEKIVSIGEIGLDYHWIKDEHWQKKQRELFMVMLQFAKEIGKPVTIHIRDAFEDAIKILEKSGVEKVHLHMYGGRKQLQRVLENGWMISQNTIILNSKTYRKIVRDTPITMLMTETDSPWLGFGQRNTPLAVKKVVKKISEIKKLDEKEVDVMTTRNAINFFNLKR